MNTFTNYLLTYEIILEPEHGTVIGCLHMKKQSALFTSGGYGAEMERCDLVSGQAALQA